MSRTTHRKRYARTDALTTAYMRLRKEGVPSFVTSHEAYRMTDGRVGTKGDHNLQHGFGLMSLVQKADGDLHDPKVEQDVCGHDEMLPVPGLPVAQVCMDCGLTQIDEDDRTAAESVAPTGPARGDVVSYTKTLLSKGEAARWQVRSVDSDGTLTIDLIGNVKRSTARSGVDPAKVTIRSN